MKTFVPLSSIADVFNGKTPSKDEQRESGHPVLKIKDVDERGDFRGRFSGFVDRDLAQKHSSRLLVEGDTLILNAAHSATHVASKTSYATSKVSGSLATGEWLIVRPRTKVASPRFVHHWINSECIRRTLRELVNGIHLYPKDVAKLQFPIFSLGEQMRVAAILDKADLIRRKRQQALRLTDDFLRSVFLEMFGDPSTNPKKWKTVTFEEVAADTKLGLVRSSEEFDWGMPVPYVRMDAITSDGAFLPEKVQGTNAAASEVADYGLKKGDFLFNTRNSKELVGKVAIYPGPGNATFNNNLMRVRFRPGVDPYFICQQFQFEKAKKDLEQRKQGTTSVYAIYWKNLATMPILLPPKELQAEFRGVIERVSDVRARLSASAKESSLLFASLQQRAFSGQL